MREKASFKQKISLHRLIRLRQRYIFTRGNKIRLRYIVSTVVLCSVVAFSGVSASPLGTAMKSAIHNSAKTVIAKRDDVRQSQDQEAMSRLAMQDEISEGMRNAALAIKKRPPPLDKKLTIGRGDTVAGLLQKAGLSGGEAHRTIEALGKHVDLRTVRPGQSLLVHFKPGADDDTPQFEKLTMDISPVKEVSIIKNGNDEFTSNLYEKELEDRTYARAAEIETSLYGSAMKAGIPAQIIANAIRTYSWSVDFQRDIRRGDKIEVLYDTQETEDGEYTKYGDILYANLSVGGRDIPIYRFEMKDGRVDYFMADGQSIRKTLMKTPIDGARISSGFGMRKHPVLGYSKMHKGMDFAAATGTPIYAAGDGIVEYAARFSSYGNYIKIRHNSTLKTAYAHMHKFAKGISKGVRVKQGQVIGYVGTTGRSTGPHLHYEVLVNNVQKNPNSIDLPVGEKLAGAELERFKAEVKKLDQRYMALSDGLKVAQKRDQDSGEHFLR